MTDTTTTTPTTTPEVTEEKVTPSQKFSAVARLFSIADVAKLTELAGQTVTTYVMTEVAPAPDYLVGERMVWISLDPWQEWLDARKAAAEAKAAEAAEKAAADVAKLATKVAASAQSFDTETRSSLLSALLSKLTPEEKAALLSAS